MLSTGKNEQNEIPTYIPFKYPKRYSKNQLIKQSKFEIAHDVNHYELLRDSLDSGTADVETMAEEPLNRNKERKDNSKTNSQKANGDDKSQVLTILGDSISTIEGQRISKKLNNKKHVVVKCFAGAKVECMSHYLKSTIDKEPEIGYSSLRNKQSCQQLT